MRSPSLPQNLSVIVGGKTLAWDLDTWANLPDLAERHTRTGESAQIILLPVTDRIMNFIDCFWIPKKGNGIGSGTYLPR